MRSCRPLTIRREHLLRAPRGRRAARGTGRETAPLPGLRLRLGARGRRERVVAAVESRARRRGSAGRTRLQPKLSIQGCSSGGTACDGELPADPVGLLGQDHVAARRDTRRARRRIPRSRPPTITRSAESSRPLAPARRAARPRRERAGRSSRGTRDDSRPAYARSLPPGAGGWTLAPRRRRDSQVPRRRGDGRLSAGVHFSAYRQREPARGFSRRRKPGPADARPWA